MFLLIVSIVAFGAALLTFFSGFGLGTILLPAFAIFFPLDMAVALTALVHLANNLFKLVLVGRHVNLAVLWKFGGTAVIFAGIGAYLLAQLGKIGSNVSYVLLGYPLETNLLSLVLGILMISFALVELSPSLKEKKIDRRYMPLGGMISGFFGGLSGHQGAFRSMFLLKAGLSKEQFISTGVVIGIVVDSARLGVYGVKFDWASLMENMGVLGAAGGAACLGSLLGQLYLKKISFSFIQTVVGILLIFLGLGVATGLI